MGGHKTPKEQNVSRGLGVSTAPRAQGEVIGGGADATSAEECPDLEITVRVPANAPRGEVWSLERAEPTGVRVRSGGFSVLIPADMGRQLTACLASGVRYTVHEERAKGGAAEDEVILSITKS